MKSSTPLTAAILAAAAIALPGIALAAPGDVLFETTFNTDGNFEGWIDSGNRLKDFDWNGTTITGEETVIGGVLRAKVTQGVATPEDAQLINNPMSPTVDAELAGSLEVRIRQTTNDGVTWKPAGSVSGMLALISGSNLGTNPARTADETVPGDGWTKVTFNLDNVVNKTLNNFRFDPAGVVNESFEIDSIRILETSKPRPKVEIDPATSIPAGMNLVREWDTAAELGQLDLQLFSNVATGASSTGSGESVSGTSSGGDPKVLTPSALDIPVGADGVAIVEIGTIPSITTGVGTANGDLFWTDNGGGFGGIRNKQIPLFNAGQLDGARHVIRVTFDSYINGVLKQLRYDPFSGTDLKVEIDYIRIYTDTPLPSALAWDNDSATSGAQGGTGNWNTTDLSWNNGTANNVAWPAVPTGDDNAVFGATAGTVTIDAGGITAHNLTFETNGYTLGGGNLILDSSVSAPVIHVAATPLTATISSVVAANDDHARKTGPGTLVLANNSTFNSFTGAGGTVTVNAGTTLNTLATNPGENNYGLKLTASTTLNINGIVTLDAGAFGGFSNDSNYVVNLNAGGELTVPGEAIVGWNASATYNFNGGTSSVGGGLLHNDSGAATINFLGGSHTIGGRMGVNTNGGGSASVVTVSGGTVTAANVGYEAGTTAAAPLGTNSLTLNLNGGSLETNRIYLNRGPAIAPGDTTFKLLLNGGTLIARPGGASASLIDGNLGISGLGPVAFNVSVEQNGVTIDTNGQFKSIDLPLAIGASSGGGLTKTGAGNLYLNRNNDYDGETRVTAGNLGGAGSVAGNVTVSPGAGLAYFITDPLNPPAGFVVSGTLKVPDPLVISIDSGAAVFPETSATGLVVVDAQSLTGFNLATVVLDTSRFTGSGIWKISETNGVILLDYIVVAGGYASWAAANANNQAADLDFDGDGVPNGVEYFMGESGSSFTPNPGVVAGTVTWPRDPAFSGTFKVQVSDTLAAGGWTDIVPPDASINTSNPNQLVFTLPAGAARKFCRLSVTPAP
jgi:autotransporter-associated beta strand protein